MEKACTCFPWFSLAFFLWLRVLVIPHTLYSPPFQLVHTFVPLTFLHEETSWWVDSSVVFPEIWAIYHSKPPAGLPDLCNSLYTMYSKSQSLVCAHWVSCTVHLNLKCVHIEYPVQSISISSVCTLWTPLYDGVGKWDNTTDALSPLLIYSIPWESLIKCCDEGENSALQPCRGNTWTYLDTLGWEMLFLGVCLTVYHTTLVDRLCFGSDFVSTVPLCFIKQKGSWWDMKALTAKPQVPGSGRGGLSTRNCYLTSICVPWCTHTDT